MPVFCGSLSDRPASTVWGEGGHSAEGRGQGAKKEHCHYKPPLINRGQPSSAESARLELVYEGGAVSMCP